MAKRAKKKAQPDYRCCSCGRQASTCWTLPCLELQCALEDGEAAVNEWCEKSGLPFRVKRAS